MFLFLKADAGVGNTKTISIEASASTGSPAHTSQIVVQMLDIISGLQGTLSNYDIYVDESTTLTANVAVGSEFIK